jgi:predicted  nucleic acid-binding Zn-ribbon protein
MDSGMKRKATEWLTTKGEVKALSGQMAALRKRLKSIETELVSLMVEHQLETIDMEGKKITRGRTVGSKDIS